VPSLPQLGGQYVSEVLALAGASVPGNGLVPLGLAGGSGLNASMVADGHVRDDQGTLDQMHLALAPESGGAEGSAFRVAVLAGNHPGSDSTSGILAWPGGCSGGAAGICTGGSVDLSPSFLPFAEGSSFDFSGRGFQPGNATGAGFARVSFHDQAGRRWDVIFDGATAFSLPTPPPGFADRSQADDTASGPPSAYVVQALDTGHVLAEAVTWGPGNVGGLDASLARFSTLWLP
jgi:hypothetical protein